MSDRESVGYRPDDRFYEGDMIDPDDLPDADAVRAAGQKLLESLANDGPLPSWATGEVLPEGKSSL